MSSKLKQLHEAKNVKDVFALVSWDTLQKLAVLPFILFALTPILFLVQNIFQTYSMELQVDSINSASWKLALGIYAFGFVKALTEKRLNKAFFKSSITLYFFAAFIILILISTYINRHEPNALSETWRSESYTSFIIYAAVYFGCGALVNDRRLKLLAIRVMQCVSMVLVVLVVIDKHVWRIEAFYPYEWSKERMVAVFNQFNFYCYYLTLNLLLSAALFVFLKSWKWRIFDGVCFIMNTWILMRDDTLGCFIAGGFGLIFLIIIQRLHDGKFNKIVLVPVGAYLFLFVLNMFTGSDLLGSFLGMFGDMKKIATNAPDAAEAGTKRWALWTNTVSYIKERPFFGFGNEGIAQRLHLAADNSRPHNEYLQYAVFFGIPAALMYISAVFSIYLRGLKRRKLLDAFTLAAFTAAFGYLVSAFFGNTTCMVAPYLFCLLGFAYRPCKERSKAVADESSEKPEPEN